MYFKDIAEGSGAYDLHVGDFVCVEGHVSIYKGELELIGKGISSREL